MADTVKSMACLWIVSDEETTCTSRHKWNQSVWPNYYCVTKENTTSNLSWAWMICCSETSNSYFRPNVWGETDKRSVSHVRRAWHSLLADVSTYLRVITWLLLFVEDVVGLEGIIVMFGCCPQSLCVFKWVSGASPKQLGRLLESQRSFTNKTCIIIQQCSIQFPPSTDCCTVYQ